MSDAAGAKAIAAVEAGDVVELTSARTFAVPSSSGDDYYIVTFAVVRGQLRTHCSCEAGRHDRPCWHVRAANLATREHPA